MFLPEQNICLSHYFTTVRSPAPFKDAFKCSSNKQVDKNEGSLPASPWALLHYVRQYFYNFSYYEYTFLHLLGCLGQRTESQSFLFW